MGRAPELTSQIATGAFTYLLAPPAWSPDGTEFVAGDLAGNLCVFEQVAGRFVARVKIRVAPAGPYSDPQVVGVAWPTREHIATLERGGVKLRSAATLEEVAVAEYVGKGTLVSGGNGTWLATLASSGVTVLGVPTMKKLFTQQLARGGFEYFSVDTLAADPKGTLVIAGDDGGRDETAMAMITDSGTPHLTLIDVAEQKIVAAIEGALGPAFAFDPWRRQIVFGSYGGEVAFYSYAGELLRQFRPNGKQHARCLAVTEQWLVMAPNDTPTIDLWDPGTLERVASAPMPDGSPPAQWLVPSPDGLRVLASTVPNGKEFRLRVWHMDVPPTCSICEHIPTSQVANTGRDIYLPASTTPLKSMELGKDADLWRCPECNAIYEYTSEQAQTGSGNNDNDTLDRLPRDHGATVRALLDGGSDELSPAQITALFALPSLTHDLVFWALYKRRRAMLRGAMSRVVARLATYGWEPGAVALRDFLCAIAALSAADARAVKAAITASTYKTPHPFEHVLAACS